MPDVQTSPFHVACAVFGIFSVLFGLVSHLVKERLFISESLIALITGAITGPGVANFINPLQWVGGNAADLKTTTINFTRLVLSIQVMLAGVQLPAKFAKRSRRFLGAILGPGMVGMWVTSSFLVWAICVLPGGGRMPFLHALAVGACVAPTDPVLAVTVIKGRFADLHIPPRLSQLISAESGANDGLGYPFLFLALYLIKYVGGNGEFVGADGGGAGAAMEMFFGENFGFVLCLSIAWGTLTGYAARKALQYAHMLGCVDRESLFAFSILLSIMLIGTCGMVGSNDILASFFAGNALSWDDWYRKQATQDSFEPVVDVLLNWAIFIYFGAICPWDTFVPSVTGIAETRAPLPLWRLACLAISLIALRRLPSVLLLYRANLLRPHVGSIKEALIMGYFGPVGVSAIFYMHVGLEYIETHILSADGQPRSDMTSLFHVMEVCVWFIVISNTIVFGLSIFAYQASMYTVHHVHPGKRKLEHPYTISGFMKHIQDILTHHGKLKKAAGEEEADMEDWFMHHKFPGRVEPVFRRIRHDVEGTEGEKESTDVESGRPQGRRIRDENRN